MQKILYPKNHDTKKSESNLFNLNAKKRTQVVDKRVISVVFLSLGALGIIWLGYTKNANYIARLCQYSSALIGAVADPFVIISPPLTLIFFSFDCV